MDTTELRIHWENVYQTKDTTRVGWFQQKPIVSLNFINFLEISKTAKILDAGGGDSLLVDYLLDSGFQEDHCSGYFSSSDSEFTNQTGRSFG